MTMAQSPLAEFSMALKQPRKRLCSAEVERLDPKSPRANPSQEPAPPKKRRRIVISCTECHRRKQKCDRGLPCANCTVRRKESYCSYDTGATPKLTQKPEARNYPGSKSSSSAEPKKGHEPISSVASTWGYSQTGTSTIGFIKTIEAACSSGEDDGLTRVECPAPSQTSLAVREKYKGLVRQLPSKTYMDKLIRLYMDNYNWQYYFLDPDVFYEQLEEWNSMPFHILSTSGPHALSSDMRVFPAVLFQIAATALLVAAEAESSDFTSLKYAGNMTFEDLARDYSESGMAVLGLFGKKDVSVTTVQAQFLRAHVLKLMADVTESWHSVHVAIRDAQELGMHRDALDPKPTDLDVKTVLENQWLIQRRRKMYMVLVIWDVHTAIILGRPVSIETGRGLPSTPVDALPPSNRGSTPVSPRDEFNDRPTPLTRSLLLYKMTALLQEVRDLEQDGPYPKDFGKVKRLQQRIIDISNSTPAALRLDNPDSRWDDVGDCAWIKECRFSLAQMHEFAMMALHRPYIFHREESRLETLKSSLRMLELQRIAFDSLRPETWRNFMLFFGSFDAIVLIASIYIVFPRGLAEFKDECLRHFLLTRERFAIMASRNPLVRQAQSVLAAIWAKFTKVMHSPTPAAATGIDDSSATPASTRGTSINTPGGSNSAGPLRMADQANTTYNSILTDDTNWALSGPGSAGGLSGIAPMYPTSDLIFYDLTATSTQEPLVPLQNLQSPMLGAAPYDQNSDAPVWQFGGDFGEDTLWQFLNQLQPEA